MIIISITTIQIPIIRIILQITNPNTNTNTNQNNDNDRHLLAVLVDRAVRLEP